MLSKVRIFPVSAFGSDGYPTLSSPIKLATLESGETEVNNIRIKLTPTLKTKTLNADDREEKHSTVVGMEGELEAYNVDSTALSSLLAIGKDTNGNAHFYAGNQTDKNVCIFCEGKNEKGKKFQTWIYCATFEPLEEEQNTESDTATSVILKFSVKVITAGGKERTHARVYEGNTGYVSGEPTTSSLYKEPAVTQ